MEKRNGNSSGCDGLPSVCRGETLILSSLAVTGNIRGTYRDASLIPAFNIAMWHCINWFKESPRIMHQVNAFIHAALLCKTAHL